ncbi:hypothetical protein D3C71_1903510 [compost metagenome]
MRFQGFFLLRARGEVPIEVQAAFTYGAHALLVQQLAQLPLAVGIPGFRIVGMYAGRGEQMLAWRVELQAQL